ncbi:hypothetical protein [Nocardia farcinica]|uniref:hypothetical protein n=1 Tax=Nocardia farcinica TaxID=37329 RepID=UPI001894ABB1|nr:hypothetical protein [Nocardia farcinica]MBF6271308.1 hypothetical protein [Nocardia farcinica]MCZ9329415.1 hypothetical protein [Nocardia farcinica]
MSTAGRGGQAVVGDDLDGRMCLAHESLPGASVPRAPRREIVGDGADVGRVEIPEAVGIHACVERSRIDEEAPPARVVAEEHETWRMTRHLERRVALGGVRHGVHRDT